MKQNHTGSILLIAGCCVGAGMLGIPVVAGPAGFGPSALFFVFAWAFMALSGLVLAELVLSYSQPNINLLTMAQGLLGSIGKNISSLLFMFLFYAILTAYILATGVLISEVLPVSQTVASTLFVFAMYLVISKGMKLVDLLNRKLMAGLILCYALLVVFGLPAVEKERLMHTDFHAAWLSLPILVVSFGYHNLVPSLATYLNRDAKALRRVIIIGSLIPLFVYLLWQFVILGIVPFNDLTSWKAAQNGGEMITQVLGQSVGNGFVLNVAQGFAFFAIATSFLPVSYSFIDFLKDGYKKKEQNPAVFAALVLLPPYLISMINPSLFLQALDFAGGFCAVILFGVLPAVMAYKRSKSGFEQHFVVAKPAVLLFLLVGSLGIVALELAHIAGLIS